MINEFTLAPSGIVTIPTFLPEFLSDFQAPLSDLCSIMASGSLIISNRRQQVIAAIMFFRINRMGGTQVVCHGKTFVIITSGDKDRALNMDTDRSLQITDLDFTMIKLTFTYLDLVFPSHGPPVPPGEH